MGWSFRIARVRGIDITVHITFVLILILGAVQWGVPYGAPGALFGIILMILLFACVTLHELGHSIAAQYYGIPVRKIILLPLGGVALLARNPRRAIEELVIAVAGPLVNVVIAALLLVLTGAIGALGQLSGPGLLPGSELPPSLTTALLWLLAANVSLVVFNMIPAFPLDGGRILRAVLAFGMTWQRATRIATVIGQALAILLGVYGVLSGNILLALVAVFVFFGASQENADGQVETVLATLRVGDAYNKYALTLAPDDRVRVAVGYILRSYQPDFAVLQNGVPVGIVTHADLVQALANKKPDELVSSIMQRDVVSVDARASLDDVRRTMAERDVRIVAVYDGPMYLGLISINDIAEALSVLRFLDQDRASQPPPIDAR